jgi:hypothetical protein
MGRHSVRGRNPQCQGLVERGNQTYAVKRVIFKNACGRDGTTFCEYTYLATHLYNENTTITEMYNTTPFQLFRGRAPGTSTRGQELEPEQHATVLRACAEKMRAAAARTHARVNKGRASAISTFKIGDVVLIAAMEQQMRKKEAKRGRWGAVARIHEICAQDKDFYIVRFINQGHQTKDLPGTISKRLIFSLNLKLAPSGHRRDADAADAKAAADADPDHDDDDAPDPVGDSTEDDKPLRPANAPAGGVDIASSSDDNVPLRPPRKPPRQPRRRSGQATSDRKGPVESDDAIYEDEQHHHQKHRRARTPAPRKRKRNQTPSKPRKSRSRKPVDRSDKTPVQTPRPRRKPPPSATSVITSNEDEDDEPEQPPGEPFPQPVELTGMTWQEFMDRAKDLHMQMNTGSEPPPQPVELVDQVLGTNWQSLMERAKDLHTQMTPGSEPSFPSLFEVTPDGGGAAFAGVRHGGAAALRATPTRPTDEGSSRAPAGISEEFDDLECGFRDDIGEFDIPYFDWDAFDKLQPVIGGRGRDWIPRLAGLVKRKARRATRRARKEILRRARQAAMDSGDGQADPRSGDSAVDLSVQVPFPVPTRIQSSVHTPPH